MTLSIRLIDTDAQISKEINKLISVELNKRIRANKGKAGRALKSTIKGWILGSQEVSSLLAQGVPGSLNALFGLAPGSADSAIEAIASSVADSTQINISGLSKNLQGEIIFNFQEESMSNLLSLPQGHQITNNATDLHWLDWLLTQGDATIVKGFSYEPSNDGRSGGGTMKIGGLFRVPPEHAGVIGNNFITRVFSGKEKQISNILNQLLV